MAVVIDTSVIVELEREKPNTPPNLDALLRDQAALTTITASELLIGIHLARTEATRSRRHFYMESIIESCLILPFDLDVARIHARLGADLRSDGRMIGAHDLIIAATALTHRCEVATHNVREFERVPGLTVRQIDW